MVELGDHWLVPGYIDLHVHGGGAQCNTSKAEEITEVVHFHARYGTTGLLATTLAAAVEDLCAALIAVAQSEAPTVLGAHLEGPFLSPGWPGAMDPGVFLEPDPGQLERLLVAGAGSVRPASTPWRPRLVGASSGCDTSTTNRVGRRLCNVRPDLAIS